MNIRSLTRGDGAVIGAALLLLVVSFLSFYGAEGNCESGTVFGVEVECDTSAWEGGLLPLLPAVHLAGLVAAGLIVAGRFLPEGRKVVGLSIDQWGTALTVFAFWSALWAMFGGGERSELRIGAYLTFLFSLVLAGAAITRTMVPALTEPLIPASRPAPGGPQPGGYGYPGQAGQPGGGYGYPGGGAPSFGGGAPQGGGAPTGGGEFSPFWFAVPAQRPIFPEDGSGAPIAELTPGVWYLAVDQHGQALVAQTQDGRRGVLQDTSGIQRG